MPNAGNRDPFRQEIENDFRLHVCFTAPLRGLDKAALDMANEAVSVGETGDGSGEGGAPVKLEPMVDLGKVVFKGEKFFWRYAQWVLI